MRDGHRVAERPHWCAFTGAQAHQVASRIGPEATRPAFDSFLVGYHAAMLAGGVALVIAGGFAFVGLREGTSPALATVATEGQPA